MFQRRLLVALLVLIMLTLAQGGVAVWAIDGARQKVELGRLSSDLHAGFLAFSDSKNQLRTWLANAQQGDQPADVQERDFILHEMHTHLERLHVNSDRLAARMQPSSELTAALVEERQAALATFDKLLPCC